MSKVDDALSKISELGTIHAMKWLAGQYDDHVLSLENLLAANQSSGSLHHINHSHDVAVSNDVYWNEDMTKCPRGVKVQLLGAGGIAMYGTYDGKDKFFVSWCPVPKRMNKEK